MPGRIALVTGGSRGIGRAIAERLRSDGERVATLSRGNVPDGVGEMHLACDVGDPAALEAACRSLREAWGDVGILIANAGIVDDAPLMRMKEDHFKRVLNVNLIGCMRLVKAVLPGMVRKGHGRIILVSSTAALSGSPGQSNYAASKAGLIGFGRSMAREVGRRDITVNMVTPGWIDTAMTQALSGKQRDLAAATVPRGRFGTPEEVAAAVSFLASDDSSYVNGAVVPVDGGLGMGH